MLDEQQRTTILTLYEAGRSKRAIARALKVSRKAVRQVIKSGSCKAPTVSRAERAEPYHDDIIEQFKQCKGNLVRVHEEICAQDSDAPKPSYTALTAYCRRHGIGQSPKEPAGQYPFEPAQEMQHDTSPHPAHIAGREQPVQIAGLALAYSRLAYIQLYPRFTRFECKVFVDEAIDYVGGVCKVCMIDNTSVIVLRGTGANMVPVPEMAAFAQCRGFEFRAHEKGDANRSAVVEGLFNFVQKNFLAGRQFRDFDDANAQAIAWCDKINAAFSRKLHASRRDLFAKEQLHLTALPIWRSPVYQLHHRIVDLEGYVSVHAFRYEVPARLIGRRIEVRETKSELMFFDGPSLVMTHRRRHEGSRRIRLPETQRKDRKRRRIAQMVAEEKQLRADLPDFADYITALLKHAPRGRAVATVRRLRAIVRDYPGPAVQRALSDAAHYGLFDLHRVERMVLRNIQGTFFQAPPLDDDPHNDEE